ncbi:MAG: class I SAM-dependent methyltransferase [Betaproteobacteria bacterium]
MSLTEKVQTTPIELQKLSWESDDQSYERLWKSENGHLPPKKVVVVDDTITADQAYQFACEGTGMLWLGDFQNARQLLKALVRRVDQPSKRGRRAAKGPQKEINEAATSASVQKFHLYRQAQLQKARVLNMLLIPMEANHICPLKRAPEVYAACMEVYGEIDQAYVTSLRELIALISAYEWRKKGVSIEVLKDQPFKIHPQYGVFSPVRGEYLSLICSAPLPRALQKKSIALDIGAGTGVISILLAKKGIERIIATENNPRAIKCAKDNVKLLKLSQQIEIRDVDLFPKELASLIVCNPPWLPGKPSSLLEHAIYDPQSQMLKGFLSQLKEHLLPDGEGWLIMSNFAELLGLREVGDLENIFKENNLIVIDKLTTRPNHPRANEIDDPLFEARSQEVTSLWRLGALNDVKLS